MGIGPLLCEMILSVFQGDLVSLSFSLLIMFFWVIIDFEKKHSEDAWIYTRVI